MRKSRFNVAYCPYCNHHYTEFVYATSGERFVAIKKNKLGEWSVQPFMQCDDIRQIRIKNVEKLNGLPYLTTIKIEYTDGKVLEQVLETKNRVCPNCLKDEGRKIPALYYTSYVKTLVVTNIGLPGSGKSALAQSLAYGKRKLSDGYAIVPVKSPAYKSHLEATPINSTDLYYQFLIKDNRGAIISNIVLIDTPGELMTEDDKIGMTEYYAKLRDLIINSNWINVVLDGKKAMESDANDRTLNEIQRFLQLRSVLRKTSIVMTKGDLVRKKITNKSIKTSDGYTILNYKSPLFYEESLSITDTMKLSKYVIRKLSEKVCERVPEKREVAYFLISSGYENEKDVLNYYQSLNINKLIQQILKQIV